MYLPFSLEVYTHNCLFENEHEVLFTLHVRLPLDDSSSSPHQMEKERNRDSGNAVNHFLGSFYANKE